MKCVVKEQDDGSAILEIEDMPEEEKNRLIRKGLREFIQESEEYKNKVVVMDPEKYKEMGATASPTTVELSDIEAEFLMSKAVNNILLEKIKELDTEEDDECSHAC